MQVSEIFSNGLAQCALSLYLLATLGLTSNASPEFGSCLYSGRCMMKEFLFSPYLDINVPLRSSDSAPEKSSSQDKLESLNEPPMIVIPNGIKALTLAFATGECGSERWGDLDPKTVAASIKSFQRNEIGYVISTGGSKGAFSCGTEQGMTEFIDRYKSNHLLGFDFDIETGQSESMIVSLVEQIRVAMRQYPQLRFSFTLATLSSTHAGQASLNQHGELVMKIIAKAGLKNYFVNLMVMNYGEAKSDNCVVESNHCDMAASAIKVVQNFSQKYGLPLRRIEVTPMIGVNDVITNVFTLENARTLSMFVTNSGLGGLHFWSLNRDQPCLQTVLGVSPTCSSLDGIGRLEFANAFALNVR